MLVCCMRGSATRTRTRECGGWVSKDREELGSTARRVLAVGSELVGGETSDDWSQMVATFFAHVGVGKAMSRSSGQLSRWLLAKYLSSRSRSLAVMPLVSTAVETRRLDIHAAGSCRCSFESVLLGERPAAPAQHSHRTGLTRQPGGGLFVGSMGLCSQPHHAASVWPCQGRTTLLERAREPFITHMSFQ